MLVLRRLVIFRSVMLLRSVSGAARALRLAQPAVSRTLRELEAETGLRLFERKQKRLIPTPEGLELFEEVERLLAHEARIGDRIQALRLAETGLLRLAAIPTLSQSIVAAAAATFATERPDVRIELNAQAIRRVIELVERQEIDLGFVHGPVETSRLQVEELCEAEIVCLVPDAHPLARRSTIQLADLEKQRIVSAGPDSPPGRLLRHHAESLGVSLRFTAESNASAIRIAIARLQSSITVVDPWLPATSPTAGLVVRRIAPAMVMRALILSSPDRPLSRLATDFKSVLHSAVETMARNTQTIRPITPQRHPAASPAASRARG